MHQVISKLPMNNTRFESGLSYDAFVEHMRQNQRRIQQLLASYVLTPKDIDLFNHLVKVHHGHIYITALVEDWCPDVVLNVPVAQALAEAIEGIELRLFVRPENEDLRDRYLEDGITAIPVFSLFDANWQELGRFVERVPSVAKRVEEWTAENYPELDDLRRSVDPADREKLLMVFAKRFSRMTRWYQDGTWRLTLQAFQEILT